MLRGKESLTRLIGKRRRLLPLRESLFHTNPERSNGEGEGEGEGTSSNGGSNVDGGGGGGERVESVDWVTCPVCGNAVRGDDYVVNAHLDACLERGNKRKLTQRTLLQFSFSPRSKENFNSGKSDILKTNESQSIADENFAPSTIGVLPEVGDSQPVYSITTSDTREEVPVENSFTEDILNNKEVDSTILCPNITLPTLHTSSTNDMSVAVLDTFIVGRRFGDEVQLKEGQPISLSRDPSNIKDSSAIKVLSMDSGCPKVLGYLPRELARYLAPVMDKYKLNFKGSVMSLPQHPLDTVPVQIVCEEIPLYAKKVSNGYQDFEHLWRSVLSIIEYSKSFPPSMVKYQQNFCLLLQEVMKNDHHLFTDDEKLFIESFKTLSNDSQRLFVRLYTRKGPWFRLSNVSYPEIMDKELAVKGLCGAGYMRSFQTLTLKDYNLQEVLDVLNVSEIREICRQTRLKIPRESTKKQEFISSLVASYEDGMCPSLPALILELTGSCVRISPTAESLFWRVQRLFFLNGDQDLSAFLQVDLGLVKYPTYNCIIANHVFPDRSDLLAYEEAIGLSQVMDESVDENNMEMVLRCIEISDEFISKSPAKIIKSPNPDSMGTLHWFYSASRVHSKVVTLGISFLERERRYKDAIRLLKHLLSSVISDGRRGYWTLRLSVDLEHMGHLDESLSVAEEGLSDPWVRAGSKMALQRRILRLGKPPRRWKVPSYAESIKRNIKEVHVLGRPLNCDMGMKNRFYGDDGEQCGVEELALQHYAGEGGWQGVHAESGIWMTIFGILMWDVIFTDVPDVFRTRFQTAPLDLKTDNFYNARKSLIESHLQKIHGGSAEEILITTWESHVGTSCQGVNWDRHSLSDLWAAVTCVGGPCLASFCRLLAQDYRSWSSGMPDLFLWRFIGDYRGEAKLVEVKGPRDRLSEQQRAWMLLLMDCGFDAEVCKVSPNAKST